MKHESFLKRHKRLKRKRWKPKAFHNFLSQDQRTSYRSFHFMFYFYVKISLYSNEMTNNITKLFNEDSKNCLQYWL